MTATTEPTQGAAMTAVIGLDLSLTATGVALPNGTTMTIKTRVVDGDERLLHIVETVMYAVTQSSVVDLVVIEDLPVHAKSAGITGMVHGAVRAALIARDVPYVLIPPATLKKYATGKGNADKTAMAVAALKRGNREFDDDNQCDAWWLRTMGMDWNGCADVLLPMAQRDAMLKVTWPMGSAAVNA